MWGGVKISPKSRREALYIAQDLSDRTWANIRRSFEAELLRHAQIVVIDAAEKKRPPRSVSPPAKLTKEPTISAMIM